VKEDTDQRPEANNVDRSEWVALSLEEGKDEETRPYQEDSLPNAKRIRQNKWRFAPYMVRTTALGSLLKSTVQERGAVLNRIRESKGIH